MYFNGVNLDVILFSLVDSKANSAGVKPSTLK